LRYCGAHVAIGELLGENFRKTVDFHRVPGNRNLIVPGLPQSYTKSRAEWIETARLFSELVAHLAKSGMRMGYHNHASEFRPLEPHPGSGTGAPSERAWTYSSETLRER
jgi:sugar phosphate isomerase/epimerase